MSTLSPMPDRLSPRPIESAAGHSPPPPEPSLAASQILDPNALAALEHYKLKDTSKSSAPIMKNNVFKVTAGNRFQAVIVFLRSQLGLKQGDPLFTYINAAFAPAPDDTVGNLFKVG
ncbi:MAG: hypothetical protein TREMPRED_000197 [Tremellales sp. Tagirdzhanova-0007]|nr:MAG: hypothetical protein TREMPRED_000197 [Tremellales sp. Tagirdzhanova-0007]